MTVIKFPLRHTYFRDRSALVKGLFFGLLVVSPFWVVVGIYLYLAFFREPRV